MKLSILILSALLAISTGNVFSIEPSDKAKAFQHLVDVNAQWALHEGEAPKMNVQFMDENERIKFHLQNVITLIRKENLTEKKTKLLSALWEYAENQTFPMNLFHNQRRPYFIDHLGTHCAVGYLMKESGHGSLAKKIQDEHNYDYVKDINTDGVLEWAVQFGFTTDELAWIQPGYLVETIFEPVPGNFNGGVKDLVSLWGPDRLYILGDFDSISGQPCNGLAVFNGTETECLDLGIDGTISKIQRQGGSLLILGDLSIGNEHFPMAYVDTNLTVHPLNIPERPDAIGVARGGWTVTSRLAITNPNTPNEVEIWEHDLINESWSQRATIFGTVNGIGISGTFIYGAFDSAHVTFQFGSDTSFAADNFFSFNTSEVLANTTPNCDTINTIVSNGSSTYMGGYSNSGPILFRYLNQTIQPLIFGDSTSINHLAEYDDTKLIVSGDIPINIGGMGYAGNNLGLYNESSNGLAALAYLDRAARFSIQFQNQWYIGGDFTDESYNGGNYLIRISKSVGINSQSHIALKITPNPAIDFINITLDSKWNDATLQIISMTGQLVLQNNVSTSQLAIDVKDIEPGTYVVRITDGNNFSSTVLIKQ